MPREFALRSVSEADLDAVMRVQALCYPAAMQEPRSVVLSRIRSAPDTTFVACADGDMLAYLFAYPSQLGAVTKLDSAFAPPARPDTLYLHDLAVAPHAAGKGLGRALVARLLRAGRERGLLHAALVSVQESERFWTGLGFVPGAAHDAAALASYPGRATYMTRPLEASGCYWTRRTLAE